jgi:hypothetical protein
MKRTILALAAAATIAAGTLTAPAPAEARCHGCGVAAGVIGGIAAGAIIGGAIANSQPRYYGPSPGYVVYDGYGAPYPAACPGGYWARASSVLKFKICVRASTHHRVSLVPNGRRTVS